MVRGLRGVALDGEAVADGVVVAGGKASVGVHHADEVTQVVVEIMGFSVIHGCASGQTLSGETGPEC